MNAIATLAPTMTSREIAELTGKQVGHVNRDAEKMLADLAGTDDPELEHVRVDRDARGYITEIHLPRELSLTLVSGYSVQMRRRIIARWQELEAKAAAPAVPALPNFTDPAEAAIAWAAEYKAKQQAQIERDDAIRTKHLIGSKREATAMATASAATREAKKLRDELGHNARHATCTAVEIATGQKFDWLPMRRWCKANGITPASVPDKRFGHVNAWPAAAWKASHQIDLIALFGEVSA